ncbi:MAG: hypothetical protein ABII27_01950 [bacterium]
MKRWFSYLLGSIIFIISMALYAEEDFTLTDPSNLILEKDVELKDREPIEKHYYQREIIKEVPEKKSKYEEQLFSEMRARLKKSKKTGEIWRVEGDLIELNKGSIHKVREGDVYRIYNNENTYIGKMEIGAIADTISIGLSYKKNHSIKKGDTARYSGQRCFWGTGLLYGQNKATFNGIGDYTFGRFSDYEMFGLYWRFVFRKDWGIGFLAGQVNMKQDGIRLNGVSNKFPDGWKKYEGFNYTYASKYYSQGTFYSIDYEGNYEINFPIDVRKYFFHPKWYTFYTGAGIAFMKISYKYKLSNTEFSGTYWNTGTTTIIKKQETSYSKLIPQLTCGTELTLGRYFKVCIALNYFHGPKFYIDGYNEFTRPLILSCALIGTW